MNKEIFTDGVSAVHVTGNLVRIDLMTVQPHLKSDTGQPVVDISNRIIMPLEGFVQSLAVQENIVSQLIDAGVLKKNPPKAAGVVSLAENKADSQSEKE
ncbi:hypothetical protein SPSIL_051470 [Sporomusa silvacetica DSM 10669]|uniref:Uncharacterized protein n=1 Tax=Sporomusa silvacetica DSM 10669 TaxID=1123289 RepID=A0ABZ3IT74_9FIRM|nr:hypothetical protein [Sporomusa silvacetica]OZC19778.1 hypothetical protein SPSIL_19050 [Sporomusa silvacetica DSM 10669]